MQLARITPARPCPCLSPVSDGFDLPPPQIHSALRNRSQLGRCCVFVVAGARDSLAIGALMFFSLGRQQWAASTVLYPLEERSSEQGRGFKVQTGKSILPVSVPRGDISVFESGKSGGKLAELSRHNMRRQIAVAPL